jgi:hypothetical protein
VVISAPVEAQNILWNGRCEMKTFTRELLALW